MPAKLGQNFLISKSIAQKMVRAAEVSPEDSILEIGPGGGILTEELLKTGAKVIAVEKDIKLFNHLKEKFGPFMLSKKLALINADIRDFLKRKIQSEKRKINKVVANIPYYLTGQLLRLLLDHRMDQTGFGPDKMVLMLQKEVAQRIVGQHSELSRKKMNLLAISVRVFAEPKIAFYVSKGNFRPQPKVDSAVVVLKRRENDFFSAESGSVSGGKERKIDQKSFFETVKTGFSHPRKLLKNNLKLQDIRCLVRCGVDENARAENLTLENWACIARFIHRKKQD